MTEIEDASEAHTLRSLQQLDAPVRRQAAVVMPKRKKL